MNELQQQIDTLAADLQKQDQRIDRCFKQIAELKQQNFKQFNRINDKLDFIIAKSTISENEKRTYLDKEIVYDEFSKQGIGKKRALTEIEKKYCVKRSHDNCRTHSISCDGRNFRGIIIINKR